MKGPGSPNWRKAGRPDKMAAKKQPAPVELAELKADTPEGLAAAAAPEAIEVIRRIMHQPGRNAAAQLRAAEAIMRYGVKEPAKATTISAPDGGAIQSEHRIVFVAPKPK